MALNIKNEAVERLGHALARQQGITETEAVRRALEAQMERSTEACGADRTAQLVTFLERDVWPFVPADLLGRASDERERERILGYGPDGV